MPNSFSRSQCHLNWLITLSYKGEKGCREYSSRPIGVTSGYVRSGLADCDLQNIWIPRKNCGSFIDATSSES